MQKPRVAIQWGPIASDYTRSPLAGAAGAASTADDIGKGLLADHGQLLAPALRLTAGQRSPLRGAAVPVALGPGPAQTLPQV
jgi:hypothetical protein